MARPVKQDPRFDWRGGVNTAFAEDAVDRTEVRRAQNAHQRVRGAWTKRPGTKRLHLTVLPGAVTGLVQWDAPGGRQTVAIADGKLYVKLDADTDFTHVASGDGLFSDSQPQSFATHRVGAAIVLYIADGTLNRFDGTTAAAVDTTQTDGGDPAALIIIGVYKGRMFGTDGTKMEFWSAIADPEEWLLANDAGFEPVETYDTEGLRGNLRVGSSLLLAKEDSVARFTGVSQDDINIDSDTEGVSAKNGLLAPRTFKLFEEAGTMLSTKGLYIITESGVQLVSDKIADQFFADKCDHTVWQDALAEVVKETHEVMLGLPGISDGGEIKTWWIWNWNDRSWAGPWVYPFGVSATAVAQLGDDTNVVLLGGTDGWVRQTDIGTRDDVLQDGTGGSVIELEIVLPDLLFGDPERVKSMHKRQVIRADLGTAFDPDDSSGGLLTVAWASEQGSGSVSLKSKGPGIKSYRFKLAARGVAIAITLTEGTAQPAQIVGTLFQATIGQAA